MKYLPILLLLAVSFTACQQKKQFFSSSPEIDMIKKLDQSFASADWTSYRSSYADTAQIWFNSWGDGTGISADSLVANLRAARANYTDVKLNDMAVYEMIETDGGDRWVHRWGRWDVQHKNGKAVSWPSHAAFLVSDGKIRGAGYIFNALPGYLANQDTSAVK